MITLVLQHIETAFKRNSPEEIRLPRWEQPGQDYLRLALLYQQDPQLRKPFERAGLFLNLPFKRDWRGLQFKYQRPEDAKQDSYDLFDTYSRVVRPCNGTISAEEQRSVTDFFTLLAEDLERKLEAQYQLVLQPEFRPAQGLFIIPRIEPVEGVYNLYVKQGDA